MIKLKLNQKFVQLSVVFGLVAALAIPAFAQNPANCDVDGDGYITLNAAGTEVILGESFKADGNYTQNEWDNFYNTFKKDVSAGTLCNALNFKTGAEPVRCDQPTISEVSGVYDPEQASGISGSSVHPGAFDNPDNGVDEDCDGADGKLVENGDGGETLKGLGQKVTSLLSYVVIFISIAFLLWGAIMYATAAGDEAKVRKATKAMIGAVIGLIVGLLAPMVVNFIVSSIT